MHIWRRNVWWMEGAWCQHWLGFWNDWWKNGLWMGSCTRSTAQARFSHKLWVISYESFLGMFIWNFGKYIYGAKNWSYEEVCLWSIFICIGTWIRRRRFLCYSKSLSWSFLQSGVTRIPPRPSQTRTIVSGPWMSTRQIESRPRWKVQKVALDSGIIIWEIVLVHWAFSWTRNIKLDHRLVFVSHSDWLIKYGHLIG